MMTTAELTGEQLADIVERIQSLLYAGCRAGEGRRVYPS
jgi:hypothetical protein